MNASSHNRLGLGCVTVLALASSIGCGGHQRHLVHTQTISLPRGRFAGPVELKLPRQAEHQGRWFEIRTVLTAACTPRLRVVYPDGEVGHIGDDDDAWQALQSRRAEASPDETAIEDEAVGASPSEPGRWQRVATESWPGQLQFIAEREQRCGKTRTYHHRYVTGVDETGTLSLLTEVPQELADAALTVEVFELIDVDGEHRATEREKRRQARAARAELSVETVVKIPPKPEPKREKPEPAEARGATWIAGQWVWASGRGKWVWVSGSWRQPGRAPALKAERHGQAPITGCTWQRGHWMWIGTRGSWKWIDGHWNAPPPRVEARGNPPVPESSWKTGRWVRAGASFKWIAGYWGRPSPRAETAPPPPYPGARWRAGTWLKLDGKWVWSAGFYEKENRKPPARKVEKPGASPAAGAVWLAGFWRWRGSRWSWVPGHWERPPGEGYVWVADPVDPTAGVSISGQWKLRIDLDRRGRPRVEVSP